MRVIITNNMPRATIFLGCVTVKPGTHFYELTADQFKGIEADDDFQFRSENEVNGKVEISMISEEEDGTLAKLTAENVKRLCETASLVELQELAERAESESASKTAKGLIANAIKVRQAEIEAANK